MTAVVATTGAVSRRRMRSPIEQMCSPTMRARSASKGAKPPSGPVTRGDGFGGLVGLQRGVRHQPVEKTPVEIQDHALIGLRLADGRSTRGCVSFLCQLLRSVLDFSGTHGNELLRGWCSTIDGRVFPSGLDGRIYVSARNYYSGAHCHMLSKPVGKHKIIAKKTAGSETCGLFCTQGLYLQLSRYLKADSPP